MREGQLSMMLINVSLNVVLGLIAVALGYALGCKT
jgi:fluoride ion exporter CrcB/FEX